MKRVLAIGALIVAGYLARAGVNPPWYTDAQWQLARAQRLGSAKFSPEAWRVADARVRATMVADLLKAHNFVGSDPNAVTEMLGSSTCYWNHGDPCYRVESWVGSHKRLVFGVSHSNRAGTVTYVAIQDR